MFRLVRVLCLSLSCGLVLSAAPTFEGNETANCGGVYKHNGGTIASPGWPNHYPAQLHCVYEIGILPGRKITLHSFSFNLRPRVGRRCLDRLSLYDGDDLIGGRDFCGREISPTSSFTSKYSKVTVVFTSHRARGTRSFPGFRATYSCTYFECGVPVFPRRPSSRSLGGNIADPGSYPWQVFLLAHRDGLVKICGGALLRENWVVTAAHCVSNADIELEVTVIFPTSYWWFRMRRGVKVQKVIVHPDFDRIFLHDDIALLKLETHVRLNDDVLRICLPDPGSETPVGTMVTVTWWDATGYEEGDVSSLLRQADMPVVNNTDCREAYAYNNVSEFHMCTGYPKGRVGACQGNTGGPVVVFPSEGPAYLVGIVSWGDGCARSGFSSVNTRVSRFVDWIRDTMHKDNVMMMTVHKN